MNFDDIVLEFDNDAHKPPVSSSETSLTDQLIKATLNEQLSPTLLPYNHSLFDTVLSRLSAHHQLLLDSHEYGDTNSASGLISPDFKLQLMIIESDIVRFSYLVKLYLRARLAKIDDFTIHYINITAANPESNSLLSQLETTYMHQHFKILTNLYNSSFLRKMPLSLALLDDSSGGQSMVEKPDLDKPVFIRCVSLLPIFIHLGNDEELQLVKNGIYVVRYSLVEPYLKLGDVELI